MSLISKILPKNQYEKEAIIKAFLIFFMTIELLVSVIFILLIRIEIDHQKHNIFLELVNYSYTFKGEKYKLELVEVEKPNHFYHLMEDENGLYIIIPIPGVEKDVLKIIYPKEKFQEDVKGIFYDYGVYFIGFTLVNLILSFGLALYAITPLRKAVELISDVARDIAHDMNTPITSLIINLKLLKKKYNDESIDRMEMAVNQLRYLSKNLNPLTEEVLLKQEEINLKKLVTEVLKDFASMYPDIEVETNLQDVKVLADRRVVRRILDNVISNAFKHNVKNGKVKVFLREGELIVENTSKPVRDINKIFERFYRESQRGMGLGLAVVKKLIHELGWKVKAEYKDGMFRIKIVFHGREGGYRN